MSDKDNKEDLLKYAHYVFLIPYEGKANKKWTLVVADSNEIILKKINFGARDMEDYTIHKDKVRKEQFLKRFKRLIDKNKDKPFSPMTLSHLILWNKTDLLKSFKDYADRFDLTLYKLNGEPIKYL